MPRGARTSVSIVSIAKQIGVSAKTVSNAFNRPDQLSAELREAILRTAREMGYAGPDPLARALRRGRSGMVGVVYDNPLSYAFADPAAVAFLAGVAEVLQTAPMGITLISGSTPAQRDVAGMRNALIDGVLAYSLASDDPVLKAIEERRLPLVTVDQPRLPAHSWVGIDDREGARQIARHLVDTGHRRIGVISFGMNRTPDGARHLLGALPPQTYEVSRARLGGYADVLLAHPDVEEVPVMHMRDSTEEEGAEAARALLARDPELTAWICLSDRLAKGAIGAATASGRRVPDDLAVAGFDDVYPDGVGGVLLTTVRQPHRDKGRIAAGMLVEVLSGSGQRMERLLESRLVIRESTGGKRR